MMVLLPDVVGAQGNAGRSSRTRLCSCVDLVEFLFERHHDGDEVVFQVAVRYLKDMCRKQESVTRTPSGGT